MTNDDWQPDPRTLRFVATLLGDRHSHYATIIANNPLINLDVIVAKARLCDLLSSELRNEAIKIENRKAKK